MEEHTYRHTQLSVSMHGGKVQIWNKYKLRNAEEQTYTIFSGDKYGKVQVWKYGRADIH